jgi:hypothetical protein
MSPTFTSAVPIRGLREFAVLDLDGNLIKFAERAGHMRGRSNPMNACTRTPRRGSAELVASIFLAATILAGLAAAQDAPK